jgi:hypothetical protein
VPEAIIPWPDIFEILFTFESSNKWFSVFRVQERTLPIHGSYSLPEY